jgi:L-serine dehydratase
MAPFRAAVRFLTKHPDAISFRVTFYGSLAATGKGRLSDVAIVDALARHDVKMIWEPFEELPLHPNGIHFEALDQCGQVLGAQEQFWLTS